MCVFHDVATHPPKALYDNHEILTDISQVLGHFKTIDNHLFLESAPHFRGDNWRKSFKRLMADQWTQYLLGHTWVIFTLK